MTRLWLVRHGPTHARALLGRTDLPADLSDAAAIARLGAALPAAPVVSSDLLRAVQTADALDCGRDRLPHEATLRELDFGDWDGRSVEDIDDPALRLFFEEPGTHRAPGGESWADLAVRVGATIDRLAAGRANLIIVAHMGTILTQWARATRLAPYDALAQVVAPLSLTRIDLRGGRAHAVWVNHRP